MDTIFALASAPGRAGVAVMRVSGAEAGTALRALAGKDLPSPRRAVLRGLRDPASGEDLDRALCLWFPGPGSFTGEDVAEFHLHGGRAVASGVALALAALPGLRPAEPGEFTRRAFHHGRLDLTEVEATADLIAAETAAQRRQALRQMDGGLSRLIEGWRGRLLRALAHIEADIDFPDEDLPDGLGAAMRAEIATLRTEIAGQLARGRQGEKLRDGIHVAILGAPNAGKSSLLNALAQREAAIVAPEAGTTRDVVEVAVDIGGYPVVLADTAGLREAAGAVEREGIRRALARAETADIRVAVFAADVPRDEWTLGLVGPQTIVVETKADLGMGVGGLRVSSLTGMGLEALSGVLVARIRELVESGGGVPLTRERHHAALAACVEALGRGLGVAGVELMAEDVRLAVRALGRVTGRVDIDDVLDVIFRDFCLGK